MNERVKEGLKTGLKIGLGVLAVVASVAAAAFAGSKDEFSSFLENASDDELGTEREKTRLDYCNPDFDDDYRESCKRKLDLFDKEISKRAWGDRTPRAPSFHREHGWYLPNDDD